MVSISYHPTFHILSHQRYHGLDVDFFAPAGPQGGARRARRAGEHEAAALEAGKTMGKSWENHGNLVV